MFRGVLGCVGVCCGVLGCVLCWGELWCVGVCWGVLEGVEGVKKAFYEAVYETVYEGVQKVSEGVGVVF